MAKKPQKTSQSEIDFELQSEEMIDEELGEELQASSEGEDEAIDYVEGSELSDFDSAEIEDVEELSPEKIIAVVESLLFATDKPQGLAALKSAFSGTQVKTADIRKALESLAIEYAGAERGVVLEEVSGGYQLRTKAENMTYLQRMVKARPFRLSGPALEVLSIVAYKQPIIKSQVDEVRGVESGHLMRGLLDRGLMRFAGKSELPGRPMLYETTKKFLETFGLRNINELPTLSEIDQLLPDGIDEADEDKKTLGDITGDLSEDVGESYSQGEEELQSITSDLQDINLTTEFFEQEKLRAKKQKEEEKAQDIRERLVVGEEVSARDKNWLERYEAENAPQNDTEPVSETELETTTEAFAPEAETQVEAETHGSEVPTESDAKPLETI